MRIVEEARHGAIENRIAEEFQPLVVLAAGAAVGKGGMAQRRLQESVAEDMLDPGEQCSGFPQRNHCTFTVLSKCTYRETLATYGTLSS